MSNVNALNGSNLPLPWHLLVLSQQQCCVRSNRKRHVFQVETPPNEWYRFSRSLHLSRSLFFSVCIFDEASSKVDVVAICLVCGTAFPSVSKPMKWTNDYYRDGNDDKCIREQRVEHSFSPRLFILKIMIVLYWRRLRCLLLIRR